MVLLLCGGGTGSTSGVGGTGWVWPLAEDEGKIGLGALGVSDPEGGVVESGQT